jgi:hypothetical protein
MHEIVPSFTGSPFITREAEMRTRFLMYCASLSCEVRRSHGGGVEDLGLLKC